MEHMRGGLHHRQELLVGIDGFFWVLLFFIWGVVALAVYGRYAKRLPKKDSDATLNGIHNNTSFISIEDKTELESDYEKDWSYGKKLKPSSNSSIDVLDTRHHEKLPPYGPVRNHVSIEDKTDIEEIFESDWKFSPGKNSSEGVTNTTSMNDETPRKFVRSQTIEDEYSQDWTLGTPPNPRPAFTKSVTLPVLTKPTSKSMLPKSKTVKFSKQKTTIEAEFDADWNNPSELQDEFCNELPDEVPARSRSVGTSVYPKSEASSRYSGIQILEDEGGVHDIDRVYSVDWKTHTPPNTAREHSIQECSN